MKLIPHCLTPKDHLRAFVVWLGLVSSRPLAHPVPYLPKTALRLYLNTFRGEPAISGFDWHFTPTHSSSQPFVPDTGSVLHPDILWASTWPWVAHPVSGLIQTTHQTCWKLHLRFRAKVPRAVRATPTNRDAQCATSLGLPPSALSPPGSRPIRTRFRFGSGTSIP